MEQLPFIIPFQLRVQAFRKFIETERESEGLNRDDSPTQHVIIKVNITKDKIFIKNVYPKIYVSYTKNSYTELFQKFFKISIKYFFRPKTAIFSDRDWSKMVSTIYQHSQHVNFGKLSE